MTALGLFLRFIRRLPDYYLTTKHIYMRAELGLPVNVCIFDDRRWFYTPDDLIVHDMWVNQTISYYARGEVRQWLKFTDGCKSLLDAGASAGFFSAVFNCTTHGAGSILSVEPDARSFRMLQETIRLNGNNKNWRAANCALSDKIGQLSFFSSGFGGDLGGAESTREAIYRGSDHGAGGGKTESVKVETIDSLCSAFEFVPDLIKMDVQGYELEVLKGATECLKTVKAVITEVSFKEYYRGQCQFHDILTFLAGFNLFTSAFGINTPIGETLEQTDMLFVRKG